jgi:hypothetical protein
MSSKTVVTGVEAAVAEFTRHTKGGGGWALGLIVACCVEPGNGQGARQPRNERYEVGKLSAQEFARRTGTSAPRILRYVDAWAQAAKQRLVASANTLSPSDWNDADHIPEGYEWNDFYDASSANGRHVVGTRREALLAQAAEDGVGPGNVLNIASNPKAMEAAIVADPRLANAAANALARREAIPDRFGGRPVGDIYPGQTESTRWMELDTLIIRMDTVMGQIDRHVHDYPGESTAARAPELHRDAEKLHMIATVAEGVSDAELADLANGGAG